MLQLFLLLILSEFSSIQPTKEQVVMISYQVRIIKEFFNFENFQTIFGILILLYALSADSLGPPALIICALFLALRISTSVHNADIIAKLIGPSLGKLVLTLSVTIIVTSGIAGISILLGGLRHKELGFQLLGTGSFMPAIAILAAITMVLPNYTSTTVRPNYSNAQLIFVSIASLAIYLVLVWAQTVSHKRYVDAISDTQFKRLEMLRRQNDNDEGCDSPYHFA